MILGLQAHFSVITVSKKVSQMGDTPRYICILSINVHLLCMYMDTALFGLYLTLLHLSLKEELTPYKDCLHCTSDLKCKS